MRTITITLILSALFLIPEGHSQSGNTIEDAIPIDGLGVSLNLLDFNSLSPSGLEPFCKGSDDAFFMHTVSAGDDKFTIAMVSAAITLLTQVDFQLLKAPNGNLNDLEEITCDQYGVLLIVGGSYEQIIDNVVPGDVYYLRLYKPGGLGGLLTSLINGTTISMVSNSTLSIDDLVQNNTKIVVNDDRIMIYGQSEYARYSIYSIEGKEVLKQVSNQPLEQIDISVLRNGLYILVLDGANNARTVHKFVKS